MSSKISFSSPLGNTDATDELPRGPPQHWISIPPPSDSDSRWDDIKRKKEKDLAVERLQKHARAAMVIEFTTIPLYLYAVWSIKPDNGGPGTKARYSILSIVQQEMLHLALVGNLARALNYEFKLYNPDAMAVFDGDCKMLYDKVQLNLEPAKKRLLGTFVKIEAPYTPPPPPPPPPFSVTWPLGSTLTNYMAIESKRPKKTEPIAPEYRSIGEFYAEFKQGIKEVAAVFPDFLNNNRDMQFTGVDFYGDQMVVVKDLDTAMQALDIIVDQGEGSTGVDDSHYRMFLDLYRNRDMWECWLVAKNPTRLGYEQKGKLYLLYLARAFDASYCYLLSVIDAVWYDDRVTKDLVLRHKLVRCMHPLMMDILTPLAEIIVQQEFESGTAGPCFEFFGDAQGKPYPRDRLRKCIGEELKVALQAPESKDGGFKGKLEAILFTVEHSLLADTQGS